MASAVPNAQYDFNLDGIDLDAAGRDVARHYLHIQLRDLDAQIERLIRVQTHESWYMLERAAISQPAAAEIIWTNRLELHYLQAAREALVEILLNL
jgi:hypothetical protein